METGYAATFPAFKPHKLKQARIQLFKLNYPKLCEFYYEKFY